MSIMIGKKEILTLLQQYHIPYEITEHRAVYTMEQLSLVFLPYPEDDAKNLFIRDDKKRSFYLITIKGNHRLDLKAFRRQEKTRPLSMASASDLGRLLNLVPGSVTPLGLLNDKSHEVMFYLDRTFLEGSGRIGIHPNDNHATLWISVEDLIRLLKSQGIPVHLFNPVIL